MADNELLTELQTIRKHIERMDRRDRLRTVGGFFKGIISLIPIALVLVGSWYLIAHGDDVIAKIAETAAQKATSATQEQFKGMEKLQGQGSIDLKQFLNDYMPTRSSAASSSTTSSAGSTAQ